MGESSGARAIVARCAAASVCPHGRRGQPRTRPRPASAVGADELLEHVRASKRNVGILKRHDPICATWTNFLVAHPRVRHGVDGRGRKETSKGKSRRAGGENPRQNAGADTTGRPGPARPVVSDTPRRHPRVRTRNAGKSREWTGIPSEQRVASAPFATRAPVPRGMNPRGALESSHSDHHAPE
jgi:hypothetical protein